MFSSEELQRAHKGTTIDHTNMKVRISGNMTPAPIKRTISNITLGGNKSTNKEHARHYRGK